MDSAQKKQAFSRVLLALQRENGYKARFRRQVAKQILDGNIETIETLASTCSRANRLKAERECELAQEQGVELLSLCDSRYPERLRFSSDPPLVLFVRGCIEAVHNPEPSRPNIAIVGTRKAGHYGKTQAELFARLAACSGMIVTSGLAFGIDSAAHRGAVSGANLSRGCAGVAVLGSGVLNVYPSENAELVEEVLEARGAVVSEYGLFINPRKEFFPERNRIIASLSDVLIVIEADLRSGSLISARLALEEGRDVYCVPGRLTDRNFRGSHHLLRNGASLLTKLEDIFAEHPWIADRVEIAEASPLAETEKSEIELPESEREAARELVSALRDRGECHFDELLGILKCSAAELSALLAYLEMGGGLRSFPGNYYGLSN